MVTPVRQETHSFTSEGVSGGLYVYGAPRKTFNGHGLLPALTRLEGGRFEAGGVELASPTFESSFSEGDVVWINERLNTIRSVLSERAQSNTLLLTERCDNRCVFCSQPPNDREDTHLFERAALALTTFDTEEVVGLTGGEPLLDRAKILTLLETLNEWGCATPLHILTNGRAMADRQFAESLARMTADREVLWGIPLYGYEASAHDHLVASSGAFLETFQGLLNAGSCGMKIELRFIPVQGNYRELPRMIEFLATHMPFLDAISVMQLEPQGWGRKNYDELFVRVPVQAPYLKAAIEVAQLHGVQLRLFNYPLCLLPENARDFAVQSISDWKNYYPNECSSCSVRSECGGFFTSAKGRFIEEVRAL